jgi:hypothetical protein
MSEAIANADADESHAALSPAEELGTLVGWATVLFFAAEEGHNPAVATMWDAYHYIATSLSVGYANIFPVTQMGKAIGAVVMTLGPAMSARALETSRTPERDDAAILAKLDDVIAELRRANGENR